MTYIVLDSIGPSHKGDVLVGNDMTDEQAFVYAHLNFPNGSFCLVREWTWVEFGMSSTGFARLRTQGIYPVMLYSSHIVFDSQQRWPEGGFVRTSALVSFRDNFVFETRNTAYVLLGDGQRRYVAAEEERTLH